MRAVTGSRVSLLCLDASPKYVLLGSNIGSVYVFARRAPSGAPRDPATDRVSERDAHDAPLRFLDRFLVETHAGGSANKPIVALRLNPQHTRLAIAFEDGELEVVEFGEPGLGGEKKTGRVSGRYQAGIPECHRGAVITSLSWSACGDGFIGGDDRGVASLVILEGRDAGATTARFDAPLAQVSFLDDGSAAVVSTTERLYLLYRDESFAKTAVGSKPRDGPFGATSHALARAGVPDDLRDASSGCDWLLGARPGRRLWVCRVTHAASGPEGRVVATLRPSVPPPSPPPGGDLPAKPPRRWEFGRVHAVGPCLLSVSERAIAVVDFVGATVLAWYPLNDKGRGMGAARDVAVSEHRAFALGSDGGVWCLRAPANAEELVRASSRVAARAAADLDVGDATEGERAKMLDPAYHAQRLSERLRAAAPAMKTAGVETEDDDSATATRKTIAGAAAPTRGMTPWERANSSRDGLRLDDGPRVVESGSGVAGVGAAADFPPASTAEDAIGIITRTRVPKKSKKGEKKSKSKRTVGRMVDVEDPDPTPREEQDEEKPTAEKATTTLEAKVAEDFPAAEDAPVAEDSPVADLPADVPVDSPLDSPVDAPVEPSAPRSLSRAVAGEEEAEVDASGVADDREDSFFGDQHPARLRDLAAPFSGPSVRRIPVATRTSSSDEGESDAPLPVYVEGKKVDVAAAKAAAAAALAAAAAAAETANPARTSASIPRAGTAQESPMIDEMLTRNEAARRERDAVETAAEANDDADAASGLGPETPSPQPREAAEAEQSTSDEYDEYDAMIAEAEALELELERAARGETVPSTGTKPEPEPEGVVEKEAEEVAAEVEVENENEVEVETEPEAGADADAGREPEPELEVPAPKLEPEPEAASETASELETGSEPGAEAVSDASEASTGLSTPRAAASPVASTPGASPSTASEEIPSPDSPKPSATNQLFSNDSPWWMSLLGCDGCGPVRANKREKLGLEEPADLQSTPPPTEKDYHQYWLS